MSGVWLGTFAVALLAFFGTMLALGIGVLFGRDPLRGSCDGSCGDSCGRPCDTRTIQRQATEERV
jgi:hypothetical protein